MNKPFKYMSYDRALQKAMRYCMYQERCLDDMEKRFAAWNVKKEEWDKIIDCLIDQNFLSEKRFIEAYVRGKFFHKKWGRNKIVLGLKQKKVTGTNVEKIIAKEISEEEYIATINNLIKKKTMLLNESNDLKLRDKLYRYLLSKGYESETIVKQLPSF